MSRTSKYTKYTALTALVSGLLSLSPFARAADHENHQHHGHTKKAQAKPYPLDKCMISGEKLGSMGEPHVLAHEGREFQFCCKGCVKDFQADAAKFIAQFDAAWKKVKPYTAKTCLVSDEALGGMGEPHAFVHKGHEVRLCCKSCVKDFKKETAKFEEKLKSTAAAHRPHHH